MYSARLTIDTNVARGIQPSSNDVTTRARSITPASATGRKSAGGFNKQKRIRSTSNASSSSAISVVSPTASSSTESSPRMAQGRVSMDTASAPSSPLLEDTIRLPSEYVLAMHDFEPQQTDANCLSFRAGQVIHVLNRDGSGWWDGELDGLRGWFPSNYVNTDAGITSLTQEHLSSNNRRYLRHGQNRSSTSVVSWASTSAPNQHGRSHSDHRPLVSESLGSDVDSYCPPLMLPLLQGVSVLQSAVRSNRMAHFEASTACIISRVKAILAHTDCLGRDSPLLKDYPDLSQERKAMLADLAALVQQTREAILDTIDEATREAVIEDMLKTTGQIFAHTRRFLAIAVQCGVEISDGRTGSDEGHSDEQEDRWSGDRSHPPPPPYEESPTAPRTSMEHRPPMGDRNAPTMPDLIQRTKSTSDLDTPRKASVGEESDSMTPLLPHRTVVAKSKKEHYWQRNHKPNFGSTSSTSSYGSMTSPKASLPPLPQGPSSTGQVMEALRSTHDHYLSTIAAFIGHSHSYSRDNHGANTSKMYDLVKEIVDMVCRLLTIVEVISGIPDIPNHKQANLRAAKDGLFNVTSNLADSARTLGHNVSPDITEEDEKAALLRSATGALKAGADCVAAVKVCLNRSVGEKSFIIHMPSEGDPNFIMFTPGKFSKFLPPGLTPLNGTFHFGDAGEDITIQGRAPLIGGQHQNSEEYSDGSDDSNGSNQSSRGSRGSRETNGTSPDEAKPVLPPLQISQTPAERALSSPTSLAPTEDDRTTWAGSQRHRDSYLEDKLYHGTLPPAPFDIQHQAHVHQSHDAVAWMFGNDYPADDVAYNSEGHIVGATLDVLVTKMTPHESIGDAAFSAIFFMTFRLFVTPFDFVQALVNRYNIMPPAGAADAEQQEWQQRKGVPIRLRVTNIIKQWVETYWRPSADNNVIPHLSSFVRDALTPMFPTQCRRILEALGQRENDVDNLVSPKGDRTRDPGMSINPPSVAVSEVPRPTMTKPLLAALRNRNFSTILITDFDPLELARQMTIMENNLYMAILPQELLETGQQGVKSPLTVKAVSTLSTTITGWVAESILNEHDIKKRTTLVKFFIKVADRCTTLYNFSTPRSILAALDSSTISRLHQTWIGLPQKNRIQLESLRRLADHGRNYNEYRSRLKNTAPPGVPFLGLYLTDVTFCREGNPNLRPSPQNPEKKLINFNKYHKLARIVQDMQRFQVPYNLKAIPEVQEYLNGAFENAKHHGDLQDLYRRSLLVEPKQPADTAHGPPSNDMRQLFSWATRTQSQQPIPTLSSQNLPA